MSSRRAAISAKLNPGPAPTPAPLREVDNALAGSFLWSLEIFQAVWEIRGFSAAAKTLGLSQPAVSARVQALEEALGQVLFHRGPDGVKPTAAGEVLAAHARRLLELRDEIISEMRGLQHVKRGRVRLAASTTPANYVLPAVLQRFREGYPGVRLVMSISETHGVFEKVRTGEAELGVAGGASPDFVCEPLMDDEIVVIMPPSHALARAQTLTLAELQRWPWVLRTPGSGTRESVEAALEPGFFGRLEVNMELDSTEAIKLAVRAGAGLAMVSRRAVEGELQQGALVARTIEHHHINRQLYLVRNPSHPLSAAAAALWSALLHRT